MLHPGISSKLCCFWKLVDGQFLIHTKCAHETAVIWFNGTIGGADDRWNRLVARGLDEVPRSLDAFSKELCRLLLPTIIVKAYVCSSRNECINAPAAIVANERRRGILAPIDCFFRPCDFVEQTLAKRCDLVRPSRGARRVARSPHQSDMRASPPPFWRGSRRRTSGRTCSTSTARSRG